MKPFIGGIWYFRVVCIDKVPDTYYLFRSHIIDAKIIEDESLVVQLQDLYPNQFECGEWIDHPTTHNLQTYGPSRRTRDGRLQMKVPEFTLIYPTVLYVKFDSDADTIMYAKGEPEPDVLNTFKDFPRNNYDRLFSLKGLGKIPQ